MAGDDYTTTSSGVWRCWIVSTSASNCTATTTSGTDVWQSWHNTSASSSSTSTIWYSWNESHTCGTTPRIQTYRETPEQESARKVREAEYQKNQAARLKREREALERAESSLLSLLSPDQRESYAKDKKFHVITAEGKRYEIDCRKRMHNVFELNERGQRVLELCIYQTGNTPLPDNIAAQKLLLESDEKEFRRIANHTRLAHAA
jgi:hypothetical protein